MVHSLVLLVVKSDRAMELGSSQSFEDKVVCRSDQTNVFVVDPQRSRYALLFCGPRFSDRGKGKRKRGRRVVAGGTATDGVPRSVCTAWNYCGRPRSCPPSWKLSEVEEEGLAIVEPVPFGQAVGLSALRDLHCPHCFCRR